MVDKDVVLMKIRYLLSRKDMIVYEAAYDVLMYERWQCDHSGRSTAIDIEIEALFDSLKGGAHDGISKNESKHNEP
jgi:hypothetical protein